jgi:dTDP-4-amino-4,6-dideoxygalactose transaminase
MMDFSSAMGIKCLFQKLPAGSVPYCFPIVVNDPIHVQWCLKQAGIQTEIPINQPFAGRDYLLPTTAKLTDVEYLAHHVLGLPIHQDIDERELVLIQHAMTGL